MKCDFCKLGEARKKYCSTRCIKRAWHRRKYSGKKLYGTEAFWSTETGIGFKWEQYAAALLNADHLQFNNGGADLRRMNELIDVKVSHLFRRKMKRGKPTSEQAGYWVFNRNSMKPRVRWFFCICLNDDDTVAKHLMIPSDEFASVGISVGRKSRFDRFIYRVH